MTGDKVVSNNKMVKVLIVEDESLVAMDMSEMLTRLGYEVLPSAYSYEEAEQMLEEHQPDIVLLDIDLGGEKTGLDLGQLIRSKYDFPFVFITSHSDKPMVGRALVLHPNSYPCSSIRFTYFGWRRINQAKKLFIRMSLALPFSKLNTHNDC